MALQPHVMMPISLMTWQSWPADTGGELEGTSQTFKHKPTVWATAQGGPFQLPCGPLNAREGTLRRWSTIRFVSTAKALASASLSTTESQSVEPHLLNLLGGNGSNLCGHVGQGVGAIPVDELLVVVHEGHRTRGAC